MMRAVLLSDVTTAARALLCVPKTERAALCARLLGEAEAADRYARKLRKPHPKWGNGTLRGAVGDMPLEKERVCDDPEYAMCLCMVLRGLTARRFHVPAQTGWA